MLDLKKVKKIISEYHYGKNFLIKKNLTIKYHFSKNVKEILIEPFTDYSDSFKFGTCIELVYKVHKRLVKEFPNESFLRVRGTEPKFFSNKGATHHFIIYGYDYESFNSSLEEGEDEKIMELNPIVIDPSFNLVGNINDLGYKISYITRAQQNIQLPENCLISPHSQLGVPLSIDKDRLVSIQMNIDPEVVFDLVILKNLNDYVKIPLRDNSFDERLNFDKETLEIINSLREAQYIETNESLISQTETIIAR